MFIIVLVVAPYYTTASCVQGTLGEVGERPDASRPTNEKEITLSAGSGWV